MFINYLIAIFLFNALLCASAEKDIPLSSSISMYSDNCSHILDTTVKDLNGQEVNLCKYKGKILLIVNTASKCGFTKQFSDLQKLYEKYRGQGLEILAFPSNDFAQQEPGSEEQIKKFCKEELGITFPIFGKVHVRGKNQSLLYEKLSSAKGGVQWNFQKYLINKKGQAINKFAPWVNPLSPPVIKAIENEIKK
jgi:glutathione peroxidase